MKRFSDTSRFQEPWYRTLPVALKMAWEYLWANCDNAGVWHPDLALAEFQIGAKVKWDDLIEKTGRIIRLADEKWLIRGFVEVQCGETFSADSRPHKAVMALLQRHGIPLTDRLSIDYSRTTGSPKDKEPEKEEDKEPEKETRARGTEPELVSYCVSIGLPDSDGHWLFDKWQGNGWKNGSAGIKDWKSTIRSWKTAGYMASQKPGGNGRGGLDKSRTIQLTQAEMPPIWRP